MKNIINPFVTKGQWNYLIAIAKESEVSLVASQKFLSKYNIGTPADSKRMLKSLIDKELILEDWSQEKPVYQVYDVFLSRWLEVNY